MSFAKDLFSKWTLAGMIGMAAVAARSPIHAAEFRAEGVHDCTNGGFLPPNSLKVGPSALGTSMTEARFNELIDRVEKYYQPVVAAKGARLTIQRLWQDSTVNAYARRSGNEWKVEMYGGLARHSAITDDGFTLIACHEVGHHLGGAPKYRGQWAANEGQADYFATLKCLREIFSGDDNTAIVEQLRAPDSLVRSCERSFGDREAIAICVRSGMAGLSAAELMRVLNNSRPIDFTTPDAGQVSDTADSHPAAQCRLDTYSAGAVCQVASREPLSETDPTVGTCSVERGDRVGVRPLCWYKPQAGAPSPQPPPNPQPNPNPNPQPQPSPSPQPGPTGTARKLLMGGSDSVVVADPRVPIYLDYDVSEFPGAGGVYFEISRPNQDFTNPNATTPDPFHLRASAVRGVRGRLFVVPAQALAGVGSYSVRIIPLNAQGTAAVGRASGSSFIRWTGLIVRR